MLQTLGGRRILNFCSNRSVFGGIVFYRAQGCRKTPCVCPRSQRLLHKSIFFPKPILISLVKFRKIQMLQTLGGRRILNFCSKRSVFGGIVFCRAQGCRKTPCVCPRAQRLLHKSDFFPNPILIRDTTRCWVLYTINEQLQLTSYMYVREN